MQEEGHSRSIQTYENMNLKQIENSDTIGAEKERMNDQENEEVDPGSALQMVLDQIPVSSIPGIENSPVVELKTGDSVKDAFQLLYGKNVYGALISDVSDNDNSTTHIFSDRYVGFISFANMVLWCLEECEISNVETESGRLEQTGNKAFFTMLEHNPPIGQTKIMELAKSFLWDPFLPVHLDDTLFHVLLLLSNHRLQVVPVIQRSDCRVIGFVTQNAIIHVLLQSSGLEWFDNIADKTLSEFRLDNGNECVLAYDEQSISEALHSLMENRSNAIAVVNPSTKRITGSIRSSDVCTLLENDYLFTKRRSLTVKEFIDMEKQKSNSQPTDDQARKAPYFADSLRKEDSLYSRIDSLVTNRKSDTLKQAMQKLAETSSSFSFLVDDFGQVAGMLTTRDIIIQFAPPCIDSTIHGGGFFESALQQTGCRIQNGTMVCDKTR